MKKRPGMKRKKTSNRHAMRLLTIVSILSGIAIISVFYGTSMDYIHSRAVALLKEFMSSEEGGSGWLLPELDVLSTDDLEEDILYEKEKELLITYLEKREQMPFLRPSGQIRDLFLPNGRRKGGTERIGRYSPSGMCRRKFCCGPSQENDPHTGCHDGVCCGMPVCFGT